MQRENKNRLNEIKSTGPGFKAPKGYFDSLEDRFAPLSSPAEKHNNKDNADQTKVRKLNDHHSLNRVGKDPGFTVPKDYFEGMETRFAPRKKNRVIGLNGHNFKLLTLAVAASVLLVFGIPYLNRTQNVQEQLMFNEEEIAGWIESDLVSFNDYEIAEAFADVEMEEALYPEEEVGTYLNNLDIENLMLEN